MMYVQQNWQPAEYYYNDYLGLYCVVGSTIAVEDLDDLIALWESADLLTEVPMPDYVTEDTCDSLLRW